VRSGVVDEVVQAVSLSVERGGLNAAGTLIRL